MGILWNIKYAVQFAVKTMSADLTNLFHIADRKESWANSTVISKTVEKHYRTPSKKNPMQCGKNILLVHGQLCIKFGASTNKM